MEALKKIISNIGIFTNSVRWLLVLYDVIILAFVNILLLYFCLNNISADIKTISTYVLLSFGCIFLMRFVWKVYSQVWRYGGVQCYIRLILSDISACLLYILLSSIFFAYHIVAILMLFIICMNCLIASFVRLLYQYCYQLGRFDGLIKIVSVGTVSQFNEKNKIKKINVAIIGAGSSGVNLATELIHNVNSIYMPKCFVDNNVAKVRRQIQNLPVMMEDESLAESLRVYNVQEVIFSISHISAEDKKSLYDYYTSMGYKVKVYDYPLLKGFDAKKELRTFDIEELICRKPVEVIDDETEKFYKEKVVLIAGGGGSIGSELCRQLVKMSPKQVIILDIYENGAYDVQQELRFKYGSLPNIKIVILSVCNYIGLERVFKKYQPQIVINAAAHKHVPLMEDNCIEAVENNVFGTLNILKVAEKYSAERFIMISTDKAVNPTNIMGATKRMCELLTLHHYGQMICSVVRFGNVIGSAGSVVPLFKKQIASGGPVTVTDKDIIRYFMTISEASQLVLQSGVMAKDRELFILDMGKPIKIWDLAKMMIKLSGEDIKITETGLRPGEKLYEELLMQPEKMKKTDNEKIFIETEKQLEIAVLEEKINLLKAAVATGSDNEVKRVLQLVVPTYNPV